ncbi:mitochondrial import inner membrane translocase subunit Tim21-like [Glandiceps talaboti]
MQSLPACRLQQLAKLCNGRVSVVNRLSCSIHTVSQRSEICGPIYVFQENKVYCQYAQCRQFSSQNQDDRRNIVKSDRQSQDSQISTARKVAETGKTASYLGIILVGVGVTGLMFFTIGKELFSSNSPNTIYTNALKLCKSDDRVVDAIGEPIKGYGETTRRGWRKHVSHLEYEKEGYMYLRMKFYIQGRYRKGTVNLEMKKNDSGVYEYRYLFVDLDGYPQLTIVIHDKR